MKWKQYGQHFLIDHNIIEKELSIASLTKNDIVLEIGPGKGAITQELARKVKQVIAIEIDQHLYHNLLNDIPENVTLICDDVMKVDFSLLPSFTKVVANLPYQISSPITFKLLDYSFEKAVLIYQKEFAERMIASPNTGQYGRLSVNIFYKATCELIQTISKHCFSPKPKVDSAMIKLIPRDEPAFSVQNEPFFFEITKELFSYRRKKIKNIIHQKYNIDKNLICFGEKRVEMLSAEEIGLLSDEIFSYLSSKKIN